MRNRKAVLGIPSAMEGAVDRSAVVKDLRDGFAAFRKKNKPRTRIPQSLRTSVAAALEQGVDPVTVRRVCGISGTQLIQWAAAPLSSGSTALGGDASSNVRTFSVVDEARATAGTLGNVVGNALAGGASPEHLTMVPLELRLGPWSICVKLEAEGAGAQAQGGECREAETKDMERL